LVWFDAKLPYFSGNCETGYVIESTVGCDLDHARVVVPVESDNFRSGAQTVRQTSSGGESERAQITDDMISFTLETNWSTGDNHHKRRQKPV
jgi:hypothetical protein